MSDKSSGEWVKLTPLIRIARSLSIKNYPELIKEEVAAIIAPHDFPVLQVEAIPYEWDFDQNFNSVRIRFIAAHDSFSRVYSLTTNGEGRTVLTCITP